MTTAHRPTWNSVKGSNNPGGVRTIPNSIISSKQVYSNLNLKRREINPLLNSSDSQTTYKKILKNKEGQLAESIKLKIQQKEEEKMKNKYLMLNENRFYGHNENDEDEESNKLKEIDDKKLTESNLSEYNVGKNNYNKTNKENSGNYYDNTKNKYKEEYDLISENSNSSKSSKNNQLNYKGKNNDYDNEEKTVSNKFENDSNYNENKDDYDDENEGSVNEDNEQELINEYMRIQEEIKQKELEKEKLDAENIKNMSDIEILSGNPIFSHSYGLKKKWYEETVFRNQCLKDKNEKNDKNNNKVLNDTTKCDKFKNFIKKIII